MAMSRSMGARLLTTLPSMDTSPELIASSPAIILSVVVLPQPDGPTNTTNSLSRICKLTSLTACTLSKNLLIPLRTTCPIRSAFHRSGQSCDVVFDEERIGDRDGYRSQQGACHQRSPEEHVAADQFRGDPDRHGLLLSR